MIPLFVLVLTFLVTRGMGWAGVAYFTDWIHGLRAGVAAMFLFTASAHWGKRRPDLVRMVPVRLGSAEIW